MDCIRAPDHRYFHRQVSGHRRLIIGFGQRRPIGNRRVLVIVRPCPATVEDRTDVVLTHLVGRDRADIRLRHLPDLLAQGHARDDCSNPLLHRRVLGDGTRGARPLAGRFGIRPVNRRGSSDQERRDHQCREDQAGVMEVQHVSSPSRSIVLVPPILRAALPWCEATTRRVRPGYGLVRINRRGRADSSHHRPVSAQYL